MGWDKVGALFFSRVVLEELTQCITYSVSTRHFCIVFRNGFYTLCLSQRTAEEVSVLSYVSFFSLMLSCCNTDSVPLRVDNGGLRLVCFSVLLYVCAMRFDAISECTQTLIELPPQPREQTRSLTPRH